MSSTDQGSPRMSKPESQPSAPRADAPIKTVPEGPPVYIDRKGRLSVKTVDLAASETFRAQLGGMVELAKTHPPKAVSTP